MEKLLKKILEKEKEKQKLINEFQNSIWNGKLSFINKEVEEILNDLAVDLDYYVSSDKAREEDPSFYGNDRLEKEIREALDKINTIKKSLKK